MIRISIKIKQILFLYGSLILNIFIGIFISVLNTRNMTPEDYGKYRYLVNLLVLAPTFLSFGVFIAGQKLLANDDNKNIRSNLIGLISLIAVFVSLAGTLLLCGYSYFDDLIFKADMGIYIRFFSPLIIAYVLQRYLERTFAGLNRIRLLSIMRIVPKIAYLIGAIILLKMNLFRVEILLTMQLVILFVFYVLLLLKIKPRYQHLNLAYFLLRSEVNSYGIYEYWGMLINTATDKVSIFIILYYLTISDVAFFSLAGTVSAPLALLSGAIGTTLYKDFANRDSLPKKATLVTIYLAIISFLIYAIIIKYLILFLYSEEYLVVVSIATIMAAGFILRGMGDYINNFIGAHGFGKYLRNAAVINAIVNIFGYIFFINKFGLIGAAIMKVLSGIVYLLLMYYLYIKILKR